MGWWPDGTYRWLSFKNKILTRARSLRARRRLAKRTALKMLPRKEKKAAAKAKMVLRRRKGRCQPWDMRSEWWGDMFWPTKRQRQWHLENSFKEQSKRLIIFWHLGTTISTHRLASFKKLALARMNLLMSKGMYRQYIGTGCARSEGFKGL